MTDILEIDSVILDFGPRRVLQDIWLKCETGKVTGLLGRNGAGKSCLMKIVFGELVPTDRSIRLNRISIRDTYRNPSDIRFLPQRRFIPGFLTLKRIFEDFELDFADFITEFPGFCNYYNSKLMNLSSGERRIVEIYSILTSKTKFCMLDEPFSQIMPVHVEIIRKIILREKRNKGIILTDHLYRDVMGICDDLYLIRDGKTFPVRDIRDLASMGYVNELTDLAASR